MATLDIVMILSLTILLIVGQSRATTSKSLDSVNDRQCVGWFCDYAAAAMNLLGFGQNASPDNVLFGPYGGTSGSHFTDKSIFQAHGAISRIQYKLATFDNGYTLVYSIRASYGGFWGPWHPEVQRGVKHTCDDDTSYPIVQVKGNAGRYINHLEFVSTNNQTCGNSTQDVGSNFQTQTNPPNPPYASCNTFNYLEGSTGDFDGQSILVSISFNFACQTPKEE